MALTGHCNVAYMRPVRMTGHGFVTLVVNKSYHQCDIYVVRHQSWHTYDRR